MNTAGTRRIFGMWWLLMVLIYSRGWAADWRQTDTAESAVASGTLSGAQVALYNDAIATASARGAWQDGVTAIKNMLTELGISYEEINYNDLNNSTQDFSNLYKVILFPGGYAQWYNYWISKAGKDRIRKFVKNGGGYFGICAGAYFACDRIKWEGVAYDDNIDYNAYGELTGYDLDLFPGVGIGPINGIADWNTVHYKMTSLNFVAGKSIFSGYKSLPFTEKILYYGGPYFSIDPGNTIDVLAKFGYNGKPGVVSFRYGAGKVILCSPHPETSENLTSDNSSNWKLAGYMLRYLMKAGGGGGSCPVLYSWDGKNFVKERHVIVEANAPELETADWVKLKDASKYNFYLLQEVPNEHSFIDFVKLKVGDRKFSPIYARHSRLGNVLPRLLSSDNQYIEITSPETLAIGFPHLEGSENLPKELVIEGYYQEYQLNLDAQRGKGCQDEK